MRGYWPASSQVVKNGLQSMRSHQFLERLVEDRCRGPRKVGTGGVGAAPVDAQSRLARLGQRQARLLPVAPFVRGADRDVLLPGAGNELVVLRRVEQRARHAHRPRRIDDMDHGTAVGGLDAHRGVGA